MSSAAQFFKVIQARDTAAVKRMLAAEPQLASARNEKGQSALLLTVYGGSKSFAIPCWLREFLWSCMKRRRLVSWSA